MNQVAVIAQIHVAGVKNPVIINPATDLERDTGNKRQGGNGENELGGLFRLAGAKRFGSRLRRGRRRFALGIESPAQEFSGFFRWQKGPNNSRILYELRYLFRPVSI